MKTLIAVIFSLSVQAFALPPFTFLPPNNLSEEDPLHRRNSKITEAKFNEIIDSITKFYADVYEAHGVTLNVIKDWNSATVNAAASPQGVNWTLIFWGGLARRPEITEDAFALVVCHESGHLIGGYPFYSLKLSGVPGVASEGQSDYFATQSCLRRIWEKADNRIYRLKANLATRNACDTVWKTEESQNLCYRIVQASQGGSRLFSVLSGGDAPSIELKSDRMVPRTLITHPPAQCRLDTYVAGALCTKTFNPYIIPGKNHPKGQDGVEAEVFADKYACTESEGYKIGIRPSCWYVRQQGLKWQEMEAKLSPVTGDTDAFLEPGETFSLSSRTINEHRSEKLDAVQEILFVNDPTLEVPMQGRYAILEGVEPQGSGTQKTPFKFKLKSEAPCGKKIYYWITSESELGRESVQDYFVSGEPVTTEKFASTEEVELPKKHQYYKIKFETKVPVLGFIFKPKFRNLGPFDHVIRVTDPNGSGSLKALLNPAKESHVYLSPAIMPPGPKEILVQAVDMSDTKTYLTSWEVHPIRSFQCDAPKT